MILFFVNNILFTKIHVLKVLIFKIFKFIYIFIYIKFFEVDFIKSIKNGITYETIEKLALPHYC